MIGIGLLTLVPGVVGGTETYARELVRGLARVGTLDYRVFVSAAAADVVGDGLPTVVSRRYRSSYSLPGRAAAMAKGHGFAAGWAVAIAGDMLYYAVVAITTLRLNAYVKDPNTAMVIVLGLMIVVPLVVRRARGLVAR